MKAINIKWDTDKREELEQLPTEIIIPDTITGKEEISDYITEQTGYCHKGFELLNDYFIPVTWEVWDKVMVEAKSLGEAIKYIKEHIDEIPLGTEPEYINGSCKIDEYWNLGKEFDEDKFEY